MSQQQPPLAVIHRYLSKDRPTLGVMAIGTESFCTLELPWLNNAKRKSCIPAGLYLCEIIVTDKFGECILINNVPGRAEVLVHAGNTKDDTKGCILVGITCDPEVPCVNRSKEALKLLIGTIRTLNKEGKFKLEIIDG